MKTKSRSNEKVMAHSHAKSGVGPYSRLGKFAGPASRQYHERSRDEWLRNRDIAREARRAEKARQREDVGLDWGQVKLLLDLNPDLTLEDAKFLVRD